MVIVLVLLIDVGGYVAWVLSGQTPPDGFFVGAITWNIIHLIV